MKLVRHGAPGKERPWMLDADGQIRDRGLEREHSHFLNESDVKTLTDIGTFRALEFNDVARHRYSGDLNEARKHLGRL